MVEAADECKKLDVPLEVNGNPLVAKAFLHFNLLFNKYDENDKMYEVTPMKQEQIMGVTKIKELFLLALSHFR